MTRKTLQALSDAELLEVGALVLEESQARKQRRRQKVLAEIKALIAQEGLSDIVTIKGQRAKPSKPKLEAKTVRSRAKAGKASARERPPK